MPRPAIPNAICQQCTITFHPSARRKNKFCSLDCYWQYKHIHKVTPPSRRTRPDSVCLQCQQTFYTPQKPNKIFCDRECFRIWMRKNSLQGFLWSTQKAYRGKEWPRIRKEMKERDGYRCQHCGQQGGWLEVHHIKAFHSFPSTSTVEANHSSNLITLCRKCHFRVEFRL